MNDKTLTRERTLEAAQETLHRFGPAKATVVDVARALGVSHGSFCKHFASKAECSRKSGGSSSAASSVLKEQQANDRS